MVENINFPPTTRLAILRTMGVLHNEPLRYDLDSLRSLIAHLSPDLLCADITQKIWESGNLSGALLEIREALAPTIMLTDTVLVPVAPDMQRFTDYRAPSGVRRWLSQQFDRLMRWGLRKANTPEAINGLAFEGFCHLICALDEMTWSAEDQAKFQARSKALAYNIIAATQRDPGGRVLVVVQCEWHHTLEPLLEEHAPWIEIVDYREL